MHCKSCKVLIEDALDDVGVSGDVNVEKGFVEIDLAGKTMDLVKKIIEEEGYKVK